MNALEGFLAGIFVASALIGIWLDYRDPHDDAGRERCEAMLPRGMTCVNTWVPKMKEK